MKFGGPLEISLRTVLRNNPVIELSIEDTKSRNDVVIELSIEGMKSLIAALQEHLARVEQTEIPKNE